MSNIERWMGEQIDGPDGRVWVPRADAIQWRWRAVAAERERTDFCAELRGAVSRSEVETMLAAVEAHYSGRATAHEVIGVIRKRLTDLGGQ